MNKQEILTKLHTIPTEGFVGTYGNHELVHSVIDSCCEAVEEWINLQQLNNGWIPVSERLPTREEYQKDDGRFIVTDGMRRYQGIFNPYDNRFDRETHDGTLLREDKCMTAWQPLPEPYKEDPNETT